MGSFKRCDNSGKSSDFWEVFTLVSIRAVSRYSVHEIICSGAHQSPISDHEAENEVNRRRHVDATLQLSLLHSES